MQDRINRAKASIQKSCVEGASRTDPFLMQSYSFPWSCSFLGPRPCPCPCLFRCPFLLSFDSVVRTWDKTGACMCRPCPSLAMRALELENVGTRVEAGCWDWSWVNWQRTVAAVVLHSCSSRRHLLASLGMLDTCWDWSRRASDLLVFLAWTDCCCIEMTYSFLSGMTLIATTFVENVLATIEARPVSSSMAVLV